MQFWKILTGSHITTYKHLHWVFSSLTPFIVTRGFANAAKNKENKFKAPDCRPLHILNSATFPQFPNTHSLAPFWITPTGYLKGKLVIEGAIGLALSSVDSKQLDPPGHGAGTVPLLFCLVVQAESEATRSSSPSEVCFHSCQSSCLQQVGWLVLLMSQFLQNG